MGVSSPAVQTFKNCFPQVVKIINTPVTVHIWTHPSAVRNNNSIFFKHVKPCLQFKNNLPNIPEVILDCHKILCTVCIICKICSLQFSIFWAPFLTLFSLSLTQWLWSLLAKKRKGEIWTTFTTSQSGNSHKLQLCPLPV